MTAFHLGSLCTLSLYVLYRAIENHSNEEGSLELSEAVQALSEACHAHQAGQQQDLPNLKVNLEGILGSLHLFDDGKVSKNHLKEGLRTCVHLYHTISKADLPASGITTQVDLPQKQIRLQLCQMSQFNLDFMLQASILARSQERKQKLCSLLAEDVIGVGAQARACCMSLMGAHAKLKQALGATEDEARVLVVLLLLWCPEGWQIRIVEIPKMLRLVPIERQQTVTSVRSGRGHCGI
jgi:hypothetical protein